MFTCVRTCRPLWSRLTDPRTPSFSPTKKIFAFLDESAGANPFGLNSSTFALAFEIWIGLGVWVSEFPGKGTALLFDISFSIWSMRLSIGFFQVYTRYVDYCVGLSSQFDGEECVLRVETGVMHTLNWSGIEIEKFEVLWKTCSECYSTFLSYSRADGATCEDQSSQNVHCCKFCVSTLILSLLHLFLGYSWVWGWKHQREEKREKEVMDPKKFKTRMGDLALGQALGAAARDYQKASGDCFSGCNFNFSCNLLSSSFCKWSAKSWSDCKWQIPMHLLKKFTGVVGSTS